MMEFTNQELPDSHLVQYSGEYDSFEVNLIIDSDDGHSLFYNKTIDGVLENTFDGDWVGDDGHLYRIHLSPRFKRMF